MMRNPVLIIGGLSMALLGISAMLCPTEYLIWNRTKSAPQGLYWRSNGPLTLNGWAIVSGSSEAALWISERGYIGKNWPLIKRVRGVKGDQVCRDGQAILINGKYVADALSSDRTGRKLPVWHGCHVLKTEEVFLLNDHPRSLDGRYFGVTSFEDISGSARLIWPW